jgi:hypothetical protein
MSAIRPLSGKCGHQPAIAGQSRFMSTRPRSTRHVTPVYRGTEVRAVPATLDGRPTGLRRGLRAHPEQVRIPRKALGGLPTGWAPELPRGSAGGFILHEAKLSTISIRFGGAQFRRGHDNADIFVTFRARPHLYPQSDSDKARAPSQQHDSRRLLALRPCPSTVIFRAVSIGGKQQGCTSESGPGCNCKGGRS